VRLQCLSAKRTSRLMVFCMSLEVLLALLGLAW
jgi:hypothetical protein